MSILRHLFSILKFMQLELILTIEGGLQLAGFFLPLFEVCKIMYILQLVVYLSDKIQYMCIYFLLTQKCDHTVHTVLHP